MTDTMLLADRLALADLKTYLSRAGRVENGSVRLIAGSGVLAVYTAILYPRGLLDDSPTVLGLRTFALRDDAEFDAVVPTRSLLERIARVETDDGPDVVLARPHEVSTVTWAGISPPRSGWQAHGEVEAELLRVAAREGIDEVASAIPEGTGEQIVTRVRAEIWGRPVEGAEYLPAGAAFAAESLGFLGSDNSVDLFETGPWTRLSTTRGHVLVRRKAWSLTP